MKSSILFGYNCDVFNWGCRSTPNVLRKKLSANFNITKVVSNNQISRMKKAEIIELISDYETIIINGEGSPILTTPPRHEFIKHLIVVEEGVKLNKDVHYINCIFSSCPHTNTDLTTLVQAVDLFKKCKTVALRDPTSYEILNKFVDHAQFIPDIMFAYDGKFEFADLIEGISAPIESIKKGSIGISGGSWPFMLKHPVESKIESYKRLISRLLSEGNNIVLISTCDADLWLEDVAKHFNVPFIGASTTSRQFNEVFSEISIFISGRFHPSIVASTLGIPCIFFESNSHKTLSLQKMLMYESPTVFKLPFTDAAIDSIILLINKYNKELAIYNKKILNRVSELSGVINKNNLFKNEIN